MAICYDRSIKKANPLDIQLRGRWWVKETLIGTDIYHDYPHLSVLQSMQCLRNLDLTIPYRDRDFLDQDSQYSRHLSVPEDTPTVSMLKSTTFLLFRSYHALEPFPVQALTPRPSRMLDLFSAPNLLFRTRTR